MKKYDLFQQGSELLRAFCSGNRLEPPNVNVLAPSDRLYHLATCAYYRPATIHIMVNKCASPGMEGRAWSWPGYAIDRTPYGVLQHELGHHVDTFCFARKGLPNFENSRGSCFLFSKQIYEQSKEAPLTGYLGTDKEAATFYMEWFAENFRLFVTNPHLSFKLRPKFYRALREYLRPVIVARWEKRLITLQAPPRIIEQARKKIMAI